MQVFDWISLSNCDMDAAPAKCVQSMAANGSLIARYNTVVQFPFPHAQQRVKVISLVSEVFESIFGGCVI